MQRYISFATFVFALAGYAYGQVLPEPGAKLNFTQVMFDYQPVKNADQYIVEIKEDIPGNTFERPFIRQKDSATAMIISHLQFGKKYEWRYAGIVAGTIQAWQGPYKFETLDGDGITSGNGMHIRVLKNDSLKSGLGLIALDHACCIIDHDGNIVWFMYGSTITTARIGAMRDLRITPQGTLTAIIRGKLAVEFDLRTRHIWQAPNTGRISGDTTEHYSHDFQKLPNGHYMVIDGKQVWEKIPDYYDTADAPKPAAPTSQPKNVIGIGPTMNSTELQRMKIEYRDSALYARADIGVIVEYDKRGNAVWYWNSQKYIKPEDLFVKKDTPKRLLDTEFGPHMNAFYYDIKNGYVYAGFRYISRIAKIDKKTGQVVNSWGEKTLSGEAQQGNGFFNYQHDINKLKNGNLVVFDNETNSAKGKPARVVEFTDAAGSEPSKITWQFDCHFDSTGNKSARGGNVEELGNGNLLVNTGATSRIFEVTRNKQVVWEALVEKRVEDNTLSPFPLYRTHYASSLYPCYFTAQAEEKVVRTQPAFKIKIFNVGTESDSYTIKVVSPAKIFDTEFTSPTILNNRSAEFEIKAGKAVTAGDKIEVYVRSVTNPDLVRRMVFNYQP